VPRILIELSDEEYRSLLEAAKRDRRTAQAQAAQLLVGILREWAEKGKLAEANRASLRAGGALAAQQDVGAEQGHGDGPAAGVNQVVVGRPGEPQ
jgi:hypothetical protein